MPTDPLPRFRSDHRVEALLRWQHSTRGLLQPLDFIHVAEETGMIRALGWWNLQAAGKSGSGTQPVSQPSLTISVNLSVKQFLQVNLVASLEKLLRELELALNILKLEITKSTIMAEPAAAIEMLEQIKSLAVQLAADDCGRGYSSLNYLHRLPLDTRMPLPMAKSLRLDVIAEGMETAEQLAILRQLRRGYAQGYYFSEPLAADEVDALLARHPQW